MWPFKRKPQCEHDWYDTSVRDWEYDDSPSIFKIYYATIYCPKCRKWQKVTVEKWDRINACQRIQAVYNR